jgi:single-strand DNA-binding protein
VIWRKPAETLANYAKKGTLIGVVGRIQTRNYENQQGQKVFVTEVVCDNFQLLEKRDSSESQSNKGLSNEELQGYTEINLANNDPFGGSSQIDINDDDLPF